MSSRGKGRPWLTAVLGIVLCLLVTGLLVLLFARLILGGTLPVSWSAAASCVIVGFSAFAGCLLAVARSKSRKLVYSLCTGAGYLLILIVGNGIVFNGSFHRLWLMMGIVFGVSFLCGFLGSRTKKKAYHS